MGLLFVALITESMAVVVIRSGRLDHLTDRKRHPLIVAGTIDSIHRGAAFQYSQGNEFRFRVRHVILGNEERLGEVMEIPVNSFSWPEDLVHFAEGISCILVLQERYGAIDAVVPSTGRSLPVAGNAREARHILEEEILTELEEEDSARRQRALLLQLAPILRKIHAERVRLFLASEDLLVRRAAVAAVVYAAEEEDDIRILAEDVSRFFSSRTPDGLAQLIENRYQSAAFRAFIEYYFFVEYRTWTGGSRWNEREAEKHLRILNAVFATGIVSEHVKEILRPIQASPSVRRRVTHVEDTSIDWINRSLYIPRAAKHTMQFLFAIWPLTLEFVFFALFGLVFDVWTRRLVSFRRLLYLLVPSVGVFVSILPGALYPRQPEFYLMPLLGLAAVVLLAALAFERLKPARLTSISASICWLWYAWWCGYLSLMSIAGDVL